MGILRFEVLLLEEAERFLEEIDPKAKRKFLVQLKRATESLDPKIFKKLDGTLWEFRMEHARLQHRLIAFWDKKGNGLALVIATHGFIKKTDKVPLKELDRAYRIRSNYYLEKND